MARGAKVSPLSWLPPKPLAPAASERAPLWLQQCAKDSLLQSDWRYWVTGKVSAPGKRSFGNIKTMVGAQLHCTRLSKATYPKNVSSLGSKLTPKWGSVWTFPCRQGGETTTDGDWSPMSSDTAAPTALSTIPSSGISCLCLSVWRCCIRTWCSSYQLYHLIGYDIQWRLHKVTASEWASSNLSGTDGT